VTGGERNLATGWRGLFKEDKSLDIAASATEKRRRGRDFEKILQGMLAEAGLKPRIRFRPDGEEIDGSFFHRGRVLLIEAKWTQEPQPASSIYQFRGKVEGKLIGTIGVFISSGYSKDAVDALMAGKVLNVILFSDDDMRAIASEQFSFCDALDRKLRDAAEYGTPFSPLRDPVSRQPLYRPLGRLPSSLEVVPVGGAANLGPLAGAASSIGFTDGVVVIADGDGQPVARRRKIENDLTSRSPDLVQLPDIIVLDPSFEEALGIDRSVASRRQPARNGRMPDVKLQAADVRQVAAHNPGVRQLLESLGLRWGR
jgi:hypothetical protein